MYQMLFLFFFFLKILNYWLFLLQGQIRFHHFFFSFPGILCPVAMGTLAPLPSCREGACLTVGEMTEGSRAVAAASSHRQGRTELPHPTPHSQARPGRPPCVLVLN